MSAFTICNTLRCLECVAQSSVCGTFKNNRHQGMKPVKAAHLSVKQVVGQRDGQHSYEFPLMVVDWGPLHARQAVQVGQQDAGTLQLLNSNMSQAVRARILLRLVSIIREAWPLVQQCQAERDKDGSLFWLP